MSSENLQHRLQAIIDSTGESWTYAIFWQDFAEGSLLGWGDGYYKGGDDDPSSSSAAEQEHRKNVSRQLYSRISGGRSDDAADDEVTDTEWFFLISVGQSFVNGAGLPGQSFFSNEAVWIAGQDRLASSTCKRARKAQLLGLQTMVCIPLPDGVVELGSSDLIVQSPDFMNQVRVLFNATNQIQRMAPKDRSGGGRSKRLRVGATLDSPVPQGQEQVAEPVVPKVPQAEVYTPFLHGAELPKRWKGYHRLPLVAEKYFYIKDIVEKSDLGDIQLGNALSFWQKKQLVHYGKPTFKIFPSLTRLFYSTLSFNQETDNLEVKIGNEAFNFSKEDIVGMFQHTPKFLRLAKDSDSPDETDKYPSLAEMTQDLFLLPATSRRHHLKHHTHILLHRLIQANIIPSLGSKDVLKPQLVTLIYGIVHKTVIPAHVIFNHLCSMCATKPLSLPYPSLITALLVKKGYKMPRNVCEGYDCPLFKAGDWSRGFNNAYNVRLEAYQTMGSPITKGLVFNGEPLPDQPVVSGSTSSQVPSSSSPTNAQVLEAVNQLKGLLIGHTKEMRGRLDVLDGKAHVVDGRFDSLEAEVKAMRADMHAYHGVKGQDDVEPIPDDDDFDDLAGDDDEVIGDGTSQGMEAVNQEPEEVHEGMEGRKEDQVMEQ